MIPIPVRLKYTKHGMPHGSLVLRRVGDDSESPVCIVVHEYIGAENVIVSCLGYSECVARLWLLLKADERESLEAYNAVVARMEKEASGLRRLIRPRFSEIRLKQAREDARVNRLRWCVDLHAVEKEIERCGWPLPPLEIP